jgi:hypothetical protein
MIGHSYSRLVSYKRWADRGLYDVVGPALGRLEAQESAILLRILDHVHIVDRIFQRHLLGLPPAFQAPRSERIPPFDVLAESAAEVDAPITAAMPACCCRRAASRRTTTG